MNATRVDCLTPPGSAAIAVLELRGPEAWSIARKLFSPNSRPLPELPTENATWFGRIGDSASDEVILVVVATSPEPVVEVHCHGGRQVVRMLLDLFVREGCVEAKPIEPRSAADLLPFAKTLRTAGILLDQMNGVFVRALAVIDREIASADPGGLLPSPTRSEGESPKPSLRVGLGDGLEILERLREVGRHLIEPWKVVIAGAPNAGKSSLLNALAGYQRSVVAPIPGTTRDVVTATLAFDGWPVELSDTAGLRDGGDELEREGIERAHRQLQEADLCLWVIDTTDPRGADAIPPDRKLIPVLNKIDLPAAIDIARFPNGVPISATSGQGIERLIQRMVAMLVPHPPAPGAAVPVTDADREALALSRERLGPRTE